MPLFSQHTARFSPDVPLEGTSSRELLKRYQPLETLATGGFGSIEICREASPAFPLTLCVNINRRARRPRSRKPVPHLRQREDRVESI